MNIHTTLALALLGFTVMSQPALAQSNSAVDPACVMKNADGTETIDKVKCPDGMKPATSNTTTAPATGTDTTSTTGTVDTTTDPNTASIDTNANRGGLIVPPESFANARVMTASDYIGKRVYTKAGEDIGEVNDLIVTDNGAVQAVILGVGGFLGIGEKDVAVSMQSIEMQQQDNTTRLVVDATKDQLNGAPGYDRTKRTYVN